MKDKQFQQQVINHATYLKALAIKLTSNTEVANDLPRLTDLVEKGDALNDATVQMLECFVFKIIDNGENDHSALKRKNGMTIQAS